MLPINLYLVRHGESESNVANAASRDGDDSFFAGEFSNRHTSHVRLTEKGREQARAVGQWLKNEELVCFDRCYVSDYVRAKETAVLLDIPNARWYCDPQLRERDYGLIEQMSDEERRRRYPRYFELERQSKFYATCPSGESMAEVCDRVRGNILNTLHREPDTKNSVLIVCHGNIIEAIRTVLERITADEYHQLMVNDEHWFRNGNGQVVHYTRRNPENPFNILPHMGWVRSVNPYDPDYAGHDWKEIVRKTYTNEELLEIVNQYPQLIKGE